MLIWLSNQLKKKKTKKTKSLLICKLSYGCNNYLMFFEHCTCVLLLENYRCCHFLSLLSSWFSFEWIIAIVGICFCQSSCWRSYIFHNISLLFFQTIFMSLSLKEPNWVLEVLVLILEWLQVMSVVLWVTRTLHLYLKFHRVLKNLWMNRLQGLLW